ncbi:MsnO8 family LLM class oxidoreductase [Streptomyces kanamyceticus]|uniref:MsnO8 family LLM class oxidoreductase n=1 Tax=Streptomyces kanamyceticus TaxID=1967 RepID=A0A5J6G7I6_STRKN|nr:MsnO8 family LLM class oxidoreductase [Streptomyces kanamyceticus]QEU90943.1 MsnO8 family LLM class oxidoreductase [Streptomyces kanamyceticus]
MKLSVLDTAPVFAGTTGTAALRTSVELAQHAEALGYTRYWIAEHHDNPAAAATTPEVVTAAIASATTTIRVGSGGVMLPNHSTLRVAEAFTTLTALYGSRIDLGVGRALAGSPTLSTTLRGTLPAASPTAFATQIEELQRYLSHSTPTAMPHHTSVPVWILGGSVPVALTAARLGLPFAFAGHLGTTRAQDTLTAYRQSYRPSPAHPHPYAMASAGVYLAKTHKRAAQLARTYAEHLLGESRGNRTPIDPIDPKRTAQTSNHQHSMADTRAKEWICGDRSTAEAALHQYANDLALDELITLTVMEDFADRALSYEILMQAAK